MWIRKSMILSVLVMTTGIYGFGSSDLEEIKGLFNDLDTRLAAKILHASSTAEDRRNALDAARNDRAALFRFLFVTSTSIALDCATFVRLINNKHAK